MFSILLSKISLMFLKNLKKIKINLVNKSKFNSKKKKLAGDLYLHLNFEYINYKIFMFLIYIFKKRIFTFLKTFNIF